MESCCLFYGMSKSYRRLCGEVRAYLSITAMVIFIIYVGIPNNPGKILIHWAIVKLMTDSSRNYEVFHQNKQLKPFVFSWSFFHLREWNKKGTQETQRWDPPARTAYHITVLGFNILQPAERWKEREKREMKCSELPSVSILSFVQNEITSQIQ